VAAVAAVAIAIGASSDDMSSSAVTSQGGDSAPPSTPVEDSAPSDPVSESTAPTQPTIANGDLGLSVPMTAPVCDRSWVVFLGAAIDPAVYASDVQVLLDANPGAEYTLTQGGCTSMRQALDDGTLIYAVWTGTYPDQASACAARVGFGDTAYVKRMDNSTPADQLWEC
jgi:serine/threonine-protein kinase